MRGALVWYPDLLTGRPAAVFDLDDGTRWRVQFYDGFSLPDEDPPAGSVEVQFQRDGSRAKWIADGKTGGKATAVFRGVLEAISKVREHDPEIGRIGFSADSGETSRIRLYGAVIVRLGGRKVSGEPWDDRQDYYILERPAGLN